MRKMRCFLLFSTKKGKKYFLFDKDNSVDVGIECIAGKLPEPKLAEKCGEIYYFFDCSQYSCKFE